MKIKICIRCKKPKEVSEFYPSGKYISPECKVCTKERSKARTEASKIPCQRCGHKKMPSASRCQKCFISDVARPQNYCPDCGTKITKNANRCRSCQNKNHALTQGEEIGRRVVGANGYVSIKVARGKSRYSAEVSGRYGNYHTEHRYVMENHLGRPLEKSEHIHHLDGNKQNNDLSNLMLLTSSQHNKVNHFLALLGELEEADRERLLQSIMTRILDRDC